MSVRKRQWTTPKGEERTAWVTDYRDGDGKRRLKSFRTQREAKAWASKTDVEIDQGVHVPDRASCTVGKAADLWIETCKARELEQSTIEAYQQHADLHIKPLIGDKLVSKIGVPAVRAFEDELRAGGRSPAMVKRVIGSLGAIITDAQERGLAAHNAVREMRISRKGKQRRHDQRHEQQLTAGRDFPTPAEIKAFVGALEGRWKPVLMTATFCGLRASELRGLTWDAVDLKTRMLHVVQRADRFNKMGPPKSGKGRRSVPIPAGLALVLKEWRLACPRRNTGSAESPALVLDLVFPNGAGKIESHANVVNRGLVPAMIRAGVTVPVLDPEGKPQVDRDGNPKVQAKYTGLHALRHFFASWCANPVASGGVGLSLKEVQERMGHASIVMTADRYQHLFPKGDKASEVDAAEQALLG